mmetsp:Transcript_83812/g.240973  ORF Transcript_83812/g.240973 Transcript_83812/m.240973 type:complete len:367 (-) Transcript_83812:317-1417(-)
MPPILAGIRATSRLASGEHGCQHVLRVGHHRREGLGERGPAIVQRPAGPGEVPDPTGNVPDLELLAAGIAEMTAIFPQDVVVLGQPSLGHPADHGAGLVLGHRAVAHGQGLPVGVALATLWRASEYSSASFTFVIGSEAKFQPVHLHGRVERARAQRPQHAVDAQGRRIRGHIVYVKDDGGLVALAHGAHARLGVEEPTTAIRQLQVQHTVSPALLLGYKEQLPRLQVLLGPRRVDVGSLSDEDRHVVLRDIAPVRRGNYVNLRHAVALAHGAEARLSVEGPAAAVREAQEGHTLGALLLPGHGEDLARLQGPVRALPVEPRRLAKDQGLAVTGVITPEIRLVLPMSLAHGADPGLPVEDPAATIS